jgi:hypothetical protein
VSNTPAIESPGHCFRLRARCCPHPSDFIATIASPPQNRDQCVNIISGHYTARTIFEDVLCTRRIRRDHRQPAGHRFEHNQRQTLKI